LTTTEDVESIANRVHHADLLPPKPHLTPGKQSFTDNDSAKQQWQVIELSTNAGNGFQAMAVGPLNGVVDKSNIQTAYAGSNFGGAHDVAAVQSSAANHRVGFSEVRW
jgi:hypothetical protein